MSNGDRPHVRMAGALMRLMNGKPNYSKLARAIAAANPGHKERCLDRRKLAQLVADDPAEPVTLSLDELIGLDAYLSQFGEGLADRPLFEKRSPVRSLAGEGRVSVVVGAYPRESPQRNDVSRWDLLATAEILRAIEKARPGTNGLIEDALFGDESPKLPTYLRRTGPSVCTIGSPRACFASEHVLASMFKTTPFGTKDGARLPIRFFWSQPSGGVSSFEGKAAELTAYDRALARDLESGKPTVSPFTVMAKSDSSPIMLKRLASLVRSPFSVRVETRFDSEERTIRVP